MATPPKSKADRSDTLNIMQALIGSKSDASAGRETAPLTLMNNLEGIPVRVKDIGSVIAGIIFQPRARRNIVSRASGNCCFIKCVDGGIVVGLESPMDVLGIWRAMLEPEKCSCAIAKSPEIGMAILPFVGHEELDAERRQCRFVERQRALNIAHGQDNVVDLNG